MAISLAISAAVSGASAGLQYALTPKPKKPDPIDRGKLDDLRFSIPAYGAQIVKAWGTARCAPTWFWHTPAIDIPITTPGQQGGKGGSPTPPTADVTEHRYFKNLAGVFHDGQIQYVRRMWFDNELVMNNDGPTLLTSGTSSTRYEAEYGVLAGGASVATQAECSGGSKVTGLGSGGNVTIHCDVSATDLYEVAVGYTSTVDRTFKVSVNGGATTDLVCPASGGAGLVAVQTIKLTLTSGANTIKFENAGAAAPDLDYITIAPALSFTDGVDTRSFTGLQTPGRIAPTDPDIAWPVNDEPPVFSDPTGGLAGGGNYSATLAKWGSPQIRIYLGSETQEPDPLIESIKGVGNASAHRGHAYIVIEGLQLQNGRVPNVTIEFVEGTRACSAILTDLAEMVGLTPASDLDVSALSGLILGDNTGFNPGSYSAITWTGLVNATQTGGGAITKTSGATGFYNAYAVQGTTVSAGTDASIRFTAGAGTFMIGFSTTATPGSSLPNPYAQVPFAIILNLNANPSQVSKNALQMSLGGSNNTTDIGVWAPGDQFQVEIRNGRFNVYQNGLLLGGFIPPPATFPLHPIWIGYATGGGPSAASYATGSNIGSEPIIVDAGALILDSQREASELVEELMTRFQFILPEVDGKIKAVMLNASSDLTLSEAECQAYRGDDLPPKIEISRKNPLTFPKKTIVNYSDPQLDHHANAQVETRLYGPQKGTLNVSLAMVETAANMKKLAAILSSRAEVEGQTYKFTVGPKYKRIHQGTVLTITEGSSTHQVRVTNFRPDLPAGLCEVEAVRQSSVFNPTVVTQPIGTEASIVPIPGATKGVIIDGPLLRSEDGGDGRAPVVYVALCGRGSGNWPAGFVLNETPHDSNMYSILTTSDKQSGIGVTTGVLAGVSDPTVWDRISTLTINFFSNTELSSVTESDLLSNPQLNLLAIINPSTNAVEYIQHSSAVAGVALPPYLATYTISGLLRGRVGTEHNVGAHSSADDVVVIDSTIRPQRLPLADIGRTLRFKFLTSGQSADNVPVHTQTLNGVSLMPLAISGARKTLDSGNDALIEFEGRTRIGGGLRSNQSGAVNEETEEYRVQILDSGSTTLPNGRERILTVVPGMQQAAILFSSRKTFDYVTHNSFSPTTPASARTHQHIHQQGNFLEGSFIYPAGGGIACLGLQQGGAEWHTVGSELNDWQSNFTTAATTVPGILAMPYLIILGGITGNSNRLQVYEYGNRIFSASSNPLQSDYDEDFGWDSIVSTGFLFRVRFEFVGSSVVIKKSHRSDVPLARIVTGSRRSEFPLFGVTGADGTSQWSVTNVTMTTHPFPKTIYSAAQATEDGLTPGAALQVDIWQHSRLVGAGVKTRVTL